ncbi:MAG TPA: hypothetical protein VE224_02155 [Pseudolabrys sp.]|nr:hypothetical protein [Pseudolabrys sp.]
MRKAAVLSLAVGAIAMTFMASAPRASAMTSAVPAAMETVAPHNGQIEKVRNVCRRYRVHRHGRWYWRTRCHWVPGPYYYGPPGPWHHRYYRHGHWYYR